MPASLEIAVSRSGARSDSFRVPCRTSHCVPSFGSVNPSGKTAATAHRATDTEADQVRGTPTYAVAMVRSTYLTCHA